MYTVSQTLRTALNNGTPQRVLLEFVNASGTVTNTFSNEDIVVSTGVELNEMFNSETDLTIGLCPSAEIRFDMLNDVGQLENFQFGKFRAWLGARIDSGTPASGAKTKVFVEGDMTHRVDPNGTSRTYEFTPLGTFIADRPNVVKKKILSITANDQMQLFDVDMPDRTALNITYPITLSNLFKALCNKVGVTYKSDTFLNSTMSVPSEPEDFKDATMREVLGWIAEAAGSIARFDRDGKLEMAWFTSVSGANYDERNYTEFNPSWYETASIGGLHIRNSNSEAETVKGGSTNAYLIQDNPFLRASDATGT